MGATQFSMAPVYLVIIQKSQLTRDERYNDMKTAKVRVDGNKLCPGKYEDYMPSSLGGRSISVERQTVRRKSLRFEFLRFDESSEF